ncbi:polysaccharide lyase family 1 protein [Thermothielavioides terrestris NRRL 8126]|uniref:Polysaccharide lyase family 1 protein n=1 Tax=Thermothielavioides terrestris (strain ATCC 38088 / NRRL 8126) TaxID=578455 RepID=G2R151_THETT|nr:polysaccharide lyase family 1 protein [Thermothielavioides terrestris NRRL 8126]AEO66548.1 polysaccharide lyase family 1 protein [Thermothielavioides terrestris NRRL 8126]
METAIQMRMGAQMVVQSNAFKNVSYPVTSKYSKQIYATVSDNDLGGGVNNGPAGNLTATPVGCSYSLLGSGHRRGDGPRPGCDILTFQVECAGFNFVGGLRWEVRVKSGQVRDRGIMIRRGA